MDAALMPRGRRVYVAVAAAAAAMATVQWLNGQQAGCVTGRPRAAITGYPLRGTVRTCGTRTSTCVTYTLPRAVTTCSTAAAADAVAALRLTGYLAGWGVKRGRAPGLRWCM